MGHEMLRQKALSVLAEEYGESAAEARLSMIENVYAPEICDAFYSYVQTGEIPVLEYEGFTFEEVQKRTFSTVTGTFRFFHSLMTDEDFKKVFREINFGRK